MKGRPIYTYIPLPHTYALNMFMYNHVEIKKKINYYRLNFKNIR